jgi:hypothetical protein
MLQVVCGCRAEPQVWLQGLQQNGPYARNPVEPGSAPKGAVRLPVGHNGLSQSVANSGEPGQLCRGGYVHIDALVWGQWTSLANGAVSLRRRRFGCECREDLHATGCLPRTGGEITHCLPGNG